MAIQWFPGHMNAARRTVEKFLANIDVVVEVLDARLPGASSNPMIETLRQHRQRPCLKILNKKDLADPAVTKAWMAHFEAQPNVKAVALSAHHPKDVSRIVSLCQALAPHRNDATKPLRMMMMGIPNVGKSTLINTLLKRKIAKVGDEPAVTKHVTTMDLGGYATLTDTPGLMWPKIEFDDDGFMLAASHAIGKNAVLEEEVAVHLAGILLERYPEQLKMRYKIELEKLDAVAIVEQIARRRGCLAKGGNLDLEKAAHVLLNDYRSGALGAISLETPQTRSNMLLQQTKIQEIPAFIEAT